MTRGPAGRGPRFATRLLLAQALVLVAGALTIWLVASAVGPSIFHDHLEQAGVAHSDEELQEAMLAFAKCMREHGVDMPDPQAGSNGEFRVTVNGGPGSLDMEEMQAAQEACQDLMPGPMGEPREAVGARRTSLRRGRAAAVCSRAVPMCVGAGTTARLSSFTGVTSSMKRAAWWRSGSPEPSGATA